MLDFGFGWLRFADSTQWGLSILVPVSEQIKIPCANSQHNIVFTLGHVMLDV